VITDAASQPLSRPPQAAPARAAELTVVVPTFNERDNIAPLVARLDAVLAGIAWEAIFVDDDSSDGTAAAIRDVARRDPRVRCLQRLGRRGLSTACIEGALASAAPFIAVMDGDLQHDEALLPEMLATLKGERIDIVVGSRHVAGGDLGDFTAARVRISSFATRLARLVVKADLRDPMSGFFMMRRDGFEALAPRLSSQGFKILLDIVATAHGRLRIAELPFVFRERLHGESKVDSKIALDFAALLIAKLTNDAVSIRFMLFCLVGLTGIGIHMATLDVLLGFAGLQFGVAQTLATVGAIAWNFVLNNLFTYRDQRLTGWEFFTGLLRFEVICAIGAISNVGIATWIYDYDSDWWIAGLGGALMGAVWNYVVSAAFVWRQR
jgi:dolichol-phosphate mannosyltransferase